MLWWIHQLFSSPLPGKSPSNELPAAGLSKIFGVMTENVAALGLTKGPHGPGQFRQKAVQKTLAIGHSDPLAVLDSYNFV